jgi:hypothetical protein
MKFSKEAIEEFIAAYKQDTGEEITREEANGMAFRLLTLYELLSKELPNEQTSASKPLDDHRKIGFLS